MSDETFDEVRRQRDGLMLLDAFGSAIRGDWSQDGRGVRQAMEFAAGEVMSGMDPAVALHRNGVCPIHSCWIEHCPEGDGNDCPHDGSGAGA